MVNSLIRKIISQDNHPLLKRMQLRNERELDRIGFGTGKPATGYIKKIQTDA
jgi:hypothetical protein